MADKWEDAYRNFDWGSDEIAKIIDRYVANGIAIVLKRLKGSISADGKSVIIYDIENDLTCKGVARLDLEAMQREFAEARERYVAGGGDGPLPEWYWPQ